MDRRTEELYERVVEVVSAETGIGEYTMLESNLEDAVDARYVLVQVLSGYLSDQSIGKLIGKPRQTVNYMRNHFGPREGKWTVSRWMQKISGEVARLAQTIL